MSRYLLKFWKIVDGRWVLAAEESFDLALACADEIAEAAAGLVREAVLTNEEE